MADAGVGRDQAEVVERRLAPAQKGVTLDVALELYLGVFVKRVRRAEVIDLHRVIDDQIYRRQRIDFFRVAAEPLHRFPHHREIHHRRHAGQILHQHPRRHESDFFLLLGFCVPVGQSFDVGLVDVVVVFLAQ